MRDIDATIMFVAGALLVVGACRSSSATETVVTDPTLSNDGSGGYELVVLAPGATIELGGTNTHYDIKVGAKTWAVTASSLRVRTSGANTTLLDRHDNADQVPRSTLVVGGIGSHVTNVSDQGALLQVADGTTILEASLSSLFQGRGVVSVATTGNTVVLGQGNLADDATSFANTAIVGKGAIGILGAAEIGIIAGSGQVTFDPGALLDVASGNDAVTVDSGGSVGNVYIDATGARFADQPISTKQTWNVFDPVGQVAAAPTMINLSGVPGGAYIFRDATPQAQVKITGLNGTYTIVAEGQTFDFQTDSLSAYVSGSGARVSDEHENADGMPRTVLNVAGAAATVSNSSDDSAVMNIVAGSSTIGARGVGLTQGSGSVTIAGAKLTAVLLGQGRIVDSADAFANTYIVGEGDVDVHGVAIVAGVQLKGRATLEALSSACIAVGNDGMVLTNLAPESAGNVSVSSAGLRTLNGASTGILQTWDSYNPVPSM